MIPQGFLVFSLDAHAPAGDFSSLQRCPFVAPSKEAVGEAFARQSPDRAVVAVWSLDDLGGYRRELLALAEQHGLPVSIGFPS